MLSVSRLVLLVLMLLAFAACQHSSPGVALNDDYQYHVIAFNEDGCPVDPRHPERTLKPEEYECHVTCMLEKMQDWLDHEPECDEPFDVDEKRELQATRPARRRRRIMIFIHGGLNDAANAMGHANDEMQKIMDCDIYPIYVNWECGLISSYGEHLLKVNQGRKSYDHPDARKVLAPLVFFADIGRAATRIPIVWTNQAGTNLEAFTNDVVALSKVEKHKWWTDEATKYSWFRAGKSEFTKTTEAFMQLAPENLKPGAIKISIGTEHAQLRQLLPIGIAYIATMPSKYATSPIIDGLGTPAWDNMKRRTLMLFDGKFAGDPQYSKIDIKKLLDNKETHPTFPPDEFITIGGLEIFINRLEKYFAEHPQEREFTIAAHSAGTLVANEWIRRHPKMRVDHLQYMAAACSMRDFARTVIPYLQDNPSTQFYNLMLHPTAELRESAEGTDFVLRGSLLVWIDNFLADAPTSFDRTLGRWDNILPYAGMFNRVKGQVTLKAYALIDTPHPDKQQPQFHGAFTSADYWKESFRSTDQKLDHDIDAVAPKEADDLGNRLKSAH